MVPFDSRQLTFSGRNAQCRIVCRLSHFGAGHDNDVESFAAGLALRLATALQRNAAGTLWARAWRFDRGVEDAAWAAAIPRHSRRVERTASDLAGAARRFHALPAYISTV
jgi:hypothetical protein